MARITFKTDIWFVQLIESERGWGSKPFGEAYFDNQKEAYAFYVEYNSKNTEKVVPDWYAYAKEPVRIISKQK